MEPRATSPFLGRPIILSPPPLGSPHDTPSMLQAPGSSSASSTQSQSGTPSQGQGHGQGQGQGQAHLAVESQGQTQPHNQIPGGPFQAQRQQSVGYNLQHEFETLNADLDLDLRENLGSNVNVQGTQDLVASLSSGAGGPSGPSGPSTGATTSSSTNPAMSSTNPSGNSTHVNNFMTASPIPTTVNASQAGLGSLLNQNFLPSLTLPNRPQTVSDYSYFRPENSSNFYLELIRFNSWIENLSPQDNLIMIDYLCNNLPFDILLSFKSKLDQHVLSTQPQSQPHKPNSQPTGPSTNQPPTSSQSQPQSFSIHHPIPNAHPDYLPSNQLGGQNYSSLVSPPQYHHQNEFLNDLDHLSLGDGELHQPKPRQTGDANSFRSGNINTVNGISQQLSGTMGTNSGSGISVLGSGSGSGPGFQGQGPRSRPRSADPNIQKYPGNYQYLERSKSPTNHLFEKTNFLQLAAAHSPGIMPPSHSQAPQFLHHQQQHPHQHQVHQHQTHQHQIHQSHQPHLHFQSSPHGQNQNHSSEDSLDMSQKLGALATINSRVALDSNKKNYGGYGQNGAYQLPNGGYYNDPTNRTVNSNSVPVGNRSGLKSPNQRLRKNTQSPIHLKEGSMNTINNALMGGDGNNSSSTSGSSTGDNTSANTGANTGTNTGTTTGTTTNTGANTPNTTTSNSSMPADVINPELLNNIPAWLKLLRLHKYTDSLKDIPWKQLIELDDGQLEQRGVKALGARRKLLKAFDVVKGNYQ